MKRSRHTRILLFSLTTVGSLFVFTLCIEREKSIRNQALWSSMDPLTIPFPIRYNQFQKGNIVPNPSFETGKYFYEDGQEDAFYVKGWSKIGDHVEWADMSIEPFSPGDVSDGIHAIRIQREHSDETDEMGEGIMSDYIKVIPGNYNFTFEVKLEDIRSSKTRLGTKLFDAIDIRVLYYDKNKILIDGKQYYPHIDGYLDNTFKGYPFSNFWYIDRFGWGRIRGRTYNYPFSEGDLPDNVQFVRLFFGLKGTGTMWIDNVDFRLSKWNFTTLERLKPYFDSTIIRADLVIPTPKKIKEYGTISYFKDSIGRVSKPVIIIPERPSQLTMNAARLLQTKIEGNIRHGTDNETISVEIIQGIPDPSNENTMVFSIGRTGLFMQSLTEFEVEEFREHQQSYIIDMKSDRVPVVFLAGNQPIGDYYAATTAIQLFDDEDFFFHAVSVLDYPDFTGRSYLFTPWQNENELMHDVSGIDRMSMLKFNKAYIGYGQPERIKDWYMPDDLYPNGIERVGEACRKNGAVELAMMINPYYHFEYETHVDSINPSLRYKWTHSDPESLAKLKSGFRRGLDAGARTIVLMADDFIPFENGSPKRYTLYTDEDFAAFGNLQNAHAYIINSLYEWLRIYYPQTRFEFCPPWYLNEFIDRSQGKAEQYFSDLMPEIPEEIAILWTGNTVRSLSYDMADLERYKRLIGRNPMIWDNTLYARGLETEYGGYPAMYPGKVRMCNLFEPYDVFLPEDFCEYVDNHMFVNGAASSEMYRIKYATVADFEWNTKAYNPDFSLWKVLVTQFGKEQAIMLLEFNDAYYGLTDICMKMEGGRISNRLSRQGIALTEKLHILYSGLSGALKTNPDLVHEISLRKEQVIDRFELVNKDQGILFGRDSSRRQ
ncbi:MAG: beta-N-acetylglucosaminidase domain-containing protein [Bacteroidales bacterium]|nr:MAG: beta-N-acetylglucosaminidase domain-containing protein [Bacteroidales bacterium]